MDSVIDNEIDDLKTLQSLSLLTNRPETMLLDGEFHLVIGGIPMPYNVFIFVIMRENFKVSEVIDYIETTGMHAAMHRLLLRTGQQNSELEALYFAVKAVRHLFRDKVEGDLRAELIRILRYVERDYAELTASC